MGMHEDTWGYVKIHGDTYMGIQEDTWENMRIHEEMWVDRISLLLLLAICDDGTLDCGVSSVDNCRSSTRSTRPISASCTRSIVSSMNCGSN
jgi:hypothetical protein